MKVGDKFGRWEIVSIIPARSGPGGWCGKVIARCACGTERPVNGHALRCGFSKSCGCLRRETNKRIIAARNMKPGAPFRRVFRDYKYSAKQRSLVWELSAEEFFQITQRECLYCGAPPEKIERSNSGETFTWNGIDRKDPAAGYTNTNCVTSCESCNRMKRDFTFEEFLSRCAAIAKRFAD